MSGRVLIDLDTQKHLLCTSYDRCFRATIPCQWAKDGPVHLAIRDADQSQFGRPHRDGMSEREQGKFPTNEAPRSTGSLFGGKAVLTKEDLSAELQISARTIEDWRTQSPRVGPVGFIVGKHLRFRVEDVQAWLSGLAEDAASDYGR